MHIPKLIDFWCRVLLAIRVTTGLSSAGTSRYTPSSLPSRALLPLVPPVRRDAPSGLARPIAENARLTPRASWRRCATPARCRMGAAPPVCRDALARAGGGAVHCKEFESPSLPATISIKRASSAGRGDGVRILVDRPLVTWTARTTLLRPVAERSFPSTELRQFYAHRPNGSPSSRSDTARSCAAGSDRGDMEIVDLTHPYGRYAVDGVADLEHSEAAVLATHLRTIVKRRARAEHPRSAGTR